MIVSSRTMLNITHVHVHEKSNLLTPYACGTLLRQPWANCSCCIFISVDSQGSCNQECLRTESMYESILLRLHKQERTKGKTADRKFDRQVISFDALPYHMVHRLLESILAYHPNRTARHAWLYARCHAVYCMWLVTSSRPILHSIQRFIRGSVLPCGWDAHF